MDESLEDRNRTRQAERKKNLKENFERHSDAEYEMWVTVSKSTAVLNSAAVVAMLGFLQALIGKQEAITAFKLFGICALVVYLVGALLSVLTLIARRKFLFAMAREMPENAGKAHQQATTLISFALACFVVASGAVVIGIARAL